ncbi:MAG TPA: ABC-2 transporter permease [Clostridia bacterium]|jgi:hypothetical protein|nr:ABC-2 transporter permease [Clostridia bacterium]
MFNLILKDIFLLKKTILASAAYIVFFLFVFRQSGITVFPAVMVAISYMLILSGCAYENKNNSDLMLNSLPIPRSRIVAAKYLSIFVFLGWGMIIYLIVVKLFSMIKLPIEISPLSLEDLIGAIFAVSFLNSIYLPIFFKFGYIKSRIINVFIFLLIFFGFSNGVKFFIDNQNNLSLFSKQATNFQLALGIIIAALVFFLISYFISLKFYKNREF